MLLRRMLIAGLLIAVSGSQAEAGRFQGQFDLNCEVTFGSDGHTSNQRFSVDLGSGLYCPGECGRGPREIAKISPAELVLGDITPAGRARLLLRVSSDTDDLTYEAIGERRVMIFSGHCLREPFTPFPKGTAPERG